MKTNNFRKPLVVIGVCCIVLAVCSVSTICCTHTRFQERAYAIYDEVYSALQNYPALDPKYNYGAFYCRDESLEYLIVHLGGGYIAGVRDGDGKDQYYFDGGVWEVDSSGEFVSVGVSKDPVWEYSKELVEQLLSDPELTYRYEANRGFNLPLWVLPGDRYVLCSRPNNANTVEVMAIEEAGADEHFIQWNIARSNDEQVEARLFLILYDNKEIDDKTSIVYLRGWGNIPEVVSKTLLERVRIS